MSDPGWSNDWWGRDPIEQAGEEPDLADIEAMAERMRRLDAAFAADYRMLFNCLFGQNLPEMKQ